MSDLKSNQNRCLSLQCHCRTVASVGVTLLAGQCCSGSAAVFPTAVTCMSSCQQYESYLAGRRFPGQSGINYSMYGHQSGQCLQKQGFSIEFWWATRNNGSNKLFLVPQVLCHQKLVREVSCAWYFNFIKQLMSSESSIVHPCRVPLPKLPSIFVFLSLLTSVFL